ncbi:MAG: hypothetical protein ACI8WY_000747 [Planctomycetota bacterium]|jgi:hypothetical protein
MRYADSLPLSMTALTRCAISSSLAASAVASFSGAPLTSTGLCQARCAAVGLPAIARTADDSECVALPAPKALC